MSCCQCLYGRCTAGRANGPKVCQPTGKMPGGSTGYNTNTKVFLNMHHIMNILTELIPESMKKKTRNYKNVYFQAFSLFCELH